MDVVGGGVGAGFAGMGSQQAQSSPVTPPPVRCFWAAGAAVLPGGVREERGEQADAGQSADAAKGRERAEQKERGVAFDGGPALSVAVA